MTIKTLSSLLSVLLKFKARVKQLKNNQMDYYKIWHRHSVLS